MGDDQSRKIRENVGNDFPLTQGGMDGRGRVQDNIFMERLWWTVKYQYICLHCFDSGSQLRAGLKQWFEFTAVRLTSL